MPISGSLYSMNENAVTIRLRNLISSPDAWGHEEGREVFLKLLRIVETSPDRKIFRISLEGVKRTDASFPRESVMELAKRFRGTKGFCLTDIDSQDLLDNWDMAAMKKGQPLLVWDNETGNSYRIIGPSPSRGTKEVFEYVVSVSRATAVSCAKALGLKLTNASSKLKFLCEHGFLLRRDETASSGGIEYDYFPIK